MSKIKCGQCNSEYEPRLKSKDPGLNIVTPESYDYSCPLCKYGSVAESNWNQKRKQVLHD